jgi:hypothetical protein
MVAFRVGDLRVTSLDDSHYLKVLDAAHRAGGATIFPTLFAIAESDDEIDPLTFMDELARLAATVDGRGVAELIGRLRDDLMSGLAASEEG